MKTTLYVVNSSHPCEAVARALAIKGISHRTIEWPPPMHAPMQRLLFGARTVPGLQIGAERISGSRPIMQRLDELVPEPPLYPAEPSARALVKAADDWGEQVFQPVARELLWAGVTRRPRALASYGERSRLPVPAAAVHAIAPGIAAVQRRMNRTGEPVARTAIRGLPTQLDQIDGWIADRVIGDAAAPNAADLQILSTVRILLTCADLTPVIDPRPAGVAARALFPRWDGLLPAGSLPVEVLAGPPAPAARAR